jgi:hypothetical protein
MDKHDQLMSLRLTKPFTPFRISMSNGCSVEITEQLSFAVGPSAIILARPSRGGLEVRIVDIVSIDVMEPIT